MLVERGEDPSAALIETAALADPSPFVQLLTMLHRAGRLEARLEEAGAHVLALSDPGIEHVLSTEALAPYVRRWAARGLSTWDIERLGAIALAFRWLRRNAPDEAARAVRDFDAVLDRPTPPDDAWRALLFASGARLGERALDPAWRDVVRATVDRAIEVLARAPKSLSQANAERLLSGRVYADPGHFFFELLQNADDARATHVQIEVAPDAVTLTHDGAPFSIFDLVGVLSIGQTTKSSEQIGFFGVGFKSVYEITDRPRVHSGALSFEIAHVSLPRALSPLDAERAGDGRTRLILPRMRDRPLDVDALSRRAMALPPETLMTLEHVRALRVVRRDADREVVHGFRRGMDGDTVEIVAEHAAASRSYRVARGRLVFAGAREEGRAKETPVLVAAALVDGRPQPVEGATLYAFLPTAESTGLRVLVHARFDVTLDRERRELDSPWNDAILAEAGRVLASLALSFDDEALSVVPSRAELATSMRPLLEASHAVLRDAPIAVGAAGERMRPTEALIADEDLTKALAGVPIFGRRVLAPLGPRERAVVLELGAQRLDAEMLFRFAEASLAPQGAAPPWLGTAVLEALAQAPVDDEALRALPIVTTADGLSARVEVAASPWVALYAGLRALVEPSAIDALPSALSARLRVPRFDPASIAADLSGPHASELLRRPVLLDALFTASDAVLASLGEVPLVPTRTGVRATPRHVRSLAPRLAPLADVLEVPLATEDFSAHPLAARLLLPFDLEALARSLEDAPSEPLRRTLASSAILDRAEAEGALPFALGQRFAQQAIFFDVHGGLAPLVGPERALLPSAVSALVPSWPWLATVGAFVRAQRLAPVDLGMLIASLSGQGRPIADEAIDGVLAHLATQAPDLTRAQLETLAQASVFSDTAGVRRSLGALRRGTAPSLDAVFEALGQRRVASPETLRILERLGLGDRIPLQDHALLVADLAQASLDRVPRAALLRALVEAATVLARRELAPLAAQAIFLDERGALRPLGGWDAPDPALAHRAGVHRAFLHGPEGIGAPWPLLDMHEEQVLAPLLDALEVEPPTARALLDRLDAFADRPRALLAFARAERSSLLATHRQALGSLPLLTSRAGARTPSRELVLPESLAGLDGERLGLEAWVADEASAECIVALDLPFAERREVLRRAVLPRLLEGASLASCWPDDLASFAALGGLARAEGLDGWPLGLDARGLLVRPPLTSPTPEARALLAPSPIALTWADPAWAEALDVPTREAWLRPLSGVRIAELLREHADRVVSSDLYAWLRAERASLTPESLAVLAHAPLFLSQTGARRAPRELVLDREVPDLGLGWGLSDEVPEDIAAWLRASFEIDRHARRALTAHLLDALGACAREDDADKAQPLLSFLARALGADGSDAAALEERVRRLEVRARLEVPVIGEDGARSWTKPRFAWAPIDGVAREASLFVDDLPPRIALDALDAPTQRLLFACGAREDLEDATVIAALDAMSSRSIASQAALARYVLLRALREPSRIDRLALRTRAWLPRDGALFRPRDRVVSTPRTRALLGADSPRFIDPPLARLFAEHDPEGEGTARFGFVDAAALSLAEVAEANIDAVASEALLDWIEGQLVAGRVQASEVRAALPTLRVIDDEGRVRSCREVVQRGARALLGTRRGDWSASAAWPRTARALGIPRSPDAAFIEAFLIEVGAALGDGAVSDEDALALVLPQAVARLAELGAERLPEGSALAVREGARVSLVRIGDARVVFASPPELASALDGVSLLEPLPVERDATLEAMWLASGIPDLYARLRVQRVLPRGPRPDLDEAAEALRLRLPRVAAREAKAFGQVRVEGVLSLPGHAEIPVAMEVAGALSDRTLSLTPAALAQPELLAPLLAPDPQERARFLLGPVTAIDRVKRAPEPSTPKPGLFDRMRGFFQRSEAPARVPSPERASAQSEEGLRARDELHFRVREGIESQLDRGEGWLEARRRVPAYGFAFTPPQLSAPWLYAPHLIAGSFHTRGQRWSATALAPPPVRGDAGRLVMRGRLPLGESMLPVPSYGEVIEASLRGSSTRLRRSTGPSGATLVHLERPGEIEVRVRLGALPSWSRATAADVPAAKVSMVPDEELPDEVLDFVASLDDEAPPSDQAAAITRFVRTRYRYDPSYLEDPAVGHFLARTTRGRPNVHLAALHVGADATHLGAGVCFELNTLCCEMLRRAGIPAVLVTGWVMTGGNVSEPDHLWAMALLVDEHGAPAWLPLDASSTETGRPLQVPRRPPLPLRAPIDDEARAPRIMEAEVEGKRMRGARRPHGVSPDPLPKRPKKRRAPRAELRRVLHHLSTLSEQTLTDEARAEIEAALDDPQAARALIERLRR